VHISKKECSIIQKVLLEKSFDLFGQIQRSMDFERILGTEVLLRVPHPLENDAYLSTAYCIDMAYALGLLTDLTHAIFEKVIDNVEALDHRQSPYYINVPPPVVDAEFVDKIASALHRKKLPMNFIGIELTEKQAVLDWRAFGAGVDRLRELGIPLALDDYGRGYATMQFLRDVRVDRVKIDKGLLHEAKQDHGQHFILTSLVDFASEFDMEVIAEGIEDQNDFDFAKKIGCHGIQGFFKDEPKALVMHMNDKTKNNERKETIE
jgi:EAL domain-containing protein (putative c-di-GMP-specific phosphodiesterase class I)